MIEHSKRPPRSRPGLTPTLTLTLALMLALMLGASATPTLADNDLSTVPGTPAAPAFDLSGPDGQRYRLEDLRGRPAIVNFWATWCPPCRAEMPSMQRAWERLEAEGIAVIAINVADEPADVAAFLAEVPVTFPLPMDTDQRVTQAWPVRGLPTTFVLDRAGRLVYSATGEREWDDPVLLDLVRELKR